MKKEGIREVTRVWIGGEAKKGNRSKKLKVIGWQRIKRWGIMVKFSSGTFKAISSKRSSVTLESTSLIMESISTEEYVGEDGLIVGDGAGGGVIDLLMMVGWIVLVVVKYMGKVL